MQKFINGINVSDDIITVLENIATQTHNSINTLTENIKISQYELYIKGIPNF